LSVASRAFRLYREQLVRRPRAEVFAFFSDARNLESLTPGFLHFQFLTPPPDRLEPGALIVYQLRLLGIPFRWRTRIETVEEGRIFSDIQLSGPYARWHHLHEFREASGGTVVVDQVEYALPFGPLGWLTQKLFVRRALDRIFDYRRRRIRELLENSAQESEPVQ
jgi:ligand-binding SRPBCC domain-containing protein